MKGTNHIRYKMRLLALQIREMLYQLVGLLGPRMEAFPACGDASSLWVPTLAGQIPHAQRQHLRLLIRHILQPLTRACPRELRYALRTCCCAVTLQAAMRMT